MAPWGGIGGTVGGGAPDTRDNRPSVGGGFFGNLGNQAASQAAVNQALVRDNLAARQVQAAPQTMRNILSGGFQGAAGQAKQSGKFWGTDNWVASALMGAGPIGMLVGGGYNLYDWLKNRNRGYGDLMGGDQATTFDVETPGQFAPGQPVTNALTKGPLRANMFDNQGAVTNPAPVTEPPTSAANNLGAKKPYTGGF